MTPIQHKISQKLKQLIPLKPSDQLYIDLLETGTPQTELDEYLNDTHKTTAKIITGKDLETDINTLFSLGGIVSGGSALVFIHKTHTTKDIDFYFNNDLNFLRARIKTRHNKSIDCCYYFEQPHELHDIGLVMCNLYPDRSETCEPAQKALDTRISDIFLENIIWPERTAQRLLKYYKRTGVKFKAEQVLILCATWKIKPDLTQQLKTVCA